MTDEQVPLSSYCLRITKGTTPTTLGHAFVAAGINFIKSEAITPDGRIDPSTFAFIDSHTHHALSRSILQESDILFSMAGMHLGKTAVVPASMLPANTNQAVGIIRVDKNKADPRFVHYVLSSPSIRNWVHRSVAQSAQPNFNLQEIGNLPIPNLTIGKQRKIASDLAALDDKIELNRRMNETLEAMARAIFKSWFVDFDPVHAKAAGRHPFDMDADTAALFPDALEKSSLGKIPKNWRTIKIGELFEFAVGGDWGQDHPSESHNVSVAVIRGTDFSNLQNCQDEEVPRRFVQASKYEKRRLQQFDLLLEISGGSHEQPTGRSLLVTQGTLARLGGNVIPASFCRLIRSKSEHHAYFLAQYLRHLYAEGGTWIYQNQSTGISNFQFTYFSNNESLPFPTSDAIVEAFGHQVQPFFQKIDHNQAERVSLKAIRDALLPKLISGEIRVKAS